MSAGLRFVLLLLAWLALLGTGCATCKSPAAVHREFDFIQDTFSFENGLVWEYSFDPEGRMHATRREPPPDYAQHCFAVARACREFFNHAKFDPAQPRADRSVYERAIKEIVGRNARHKSPDAERVVIPGYGNLRQFSRDHADLLKSNCGKAWHSYFQRGHWRMVFPFSRTHQEKTALRLVKLLESDEPLVVHLVRFPQLTINHAVAVYAARETGSGWEFEAYDPNQPEAPTLLQYVNSTRTFSWPRSDYFAGGRVDVYRVYHGLCY